MKTKRNVVVAHNIRELSADEIDAVRGGFAVPGAVIGGVVGAVSAGVQGAGLKQTAAAAAVGAATGALGGNIWRVCGTAVRTVSKFISGK